jgi:hypothetical protein
MGHNFGAPHTHCTVPKIDRCADENGGCWDGTRECQQGTIMSYCHTCPGGVTNIALAFHERIIAEEVLPYLDTASCDLVPQPPVFVEQPQDRGNCLGGPVELSVGACGDLGMTYQWRHEGVEIPGAVGEAFVIESVAAEDEGAYDVVVSDGGEPQVSEPASVTIFASGCSGDTNRDGTVNLFDVFCVLAGIGGDFSECAFADLDIAPCGGNGVLNLNDIFAVLNAIEGIDPC